MDRLHLINVFVAVVDANGFAGAARKLNVSPPAVTRAINELESHLGVRLLTRTTRAIRVTEAGARYAEDSRRILAEILEADESMGGMHGAPRGRLTLTAPVLREAWQAAGDPALRAACLDALARLGDETAFNFLLDLLANAPPHDAHAARRALAVYRDDLRRWRKIERAAGRRSDLG